MIEEFNKWNELNERAGDWWLRVGYWGENRGSFTVRFETGGSVDVRELLAEFAMQLPVQREAAMLSRPDAQRLYEIAQQLMQRAPYKKAFEEHMAVCPEPPVLLITHCPDCGQRFDK